MDAQTYKRIGDLAKENSLTLRALRFYEERGLLVPAKKQGPTRFYDSANCARIKLIVKAIKMGFAIREIPALIKDGELRIPPDRIESMIADHETKIAQATVAITQLRLMQK